MTAYDAPVAPAAPTSLVGRVLALPPRRVRWAVFALLAMPFLIAAIVLATRHWYPVLDLAMTELRVRDVFGRHTPLIGLPGRIGHFPDQGSHPGPLSFYLLAPVYRAVGSSAWGLLLGMIVLNLVAIALALWIAQRRGGVRLVLGVGALLAVILHGYGVGVLTQPWNPYLPVMFWVVVLLAAWSVLLGDDAMVIVVAAVGSLCAQTHMPYLGLCVGMGGLCLGWFALEAWRHPVRRAALLRSAVRAAVVTVVLWLPVVVDQVRHTPGNLSMLSDYFRNPPEDPVGFGEGVRLVLRHLDLWHLLRESIGVAARDGGGFVQAGFRLDGTVVPGLLFLVVWISAAAVAVRLRHRMLIALDVVIAAALVLATISMGRIFGKVWYYLTLWMWSVTVLMVVSVAWTCMVWAGVVWAGARTGDRSPRIRPVLTGLALVVALATYVPFVVDGTRADVPEAHLSTTLRALVGPTVAALRNGEGVATGADGTYIVTWSDALYFGSQGYGLVSELERRGFHVGVSDTWRVPVTQHRVVDERSVTAEIRLATGSYIEQWRAVPGVVEAAYIEPRDAEQLAEYTALDEEVRAGLTADGAVDLVPLLDTNLFGLQLDPRVSPALQTVVNRMLVLGQPEAVFIVPPGTPPPS